MKTRKKIWISGKRQFSIKDTGIGIPSEQVEDIFLPFYQVGDAQTAREGTGLGLAISLQLARLMGSELHVKSVVGQGTTFWFDLELPIIDEYHSFEGVYPERSRGTQGKPGSGVHPEQQIVGFKGDTRTILLVDDNDENRAMLRDVLAPLGFEVVEAANGNDALNSVQKSPPNLVLMDLLMPGMDGVEATRRIRKAEGQNLRRADQHHQTPIVIIAMSASASPQIEQESRTDIRRSVAQIKASDHSLSPFALRIEQLADDFQFEQMITLIKSLK